MNPRANIMVYGLWDGVCGGRYGHRHKCSMGRQFNELIALVRESDIAMDVDINFVDLMVDNPEDAQYQISNLLNQGYRLPFVFINGKPAFFGTIPAMEIYNQAKAYIEYGYIYEE